MADLAREEADRYFSSRDHTTSHPEDQDARSIDSSDKDAEPAFDKYNSDPGTDDDDEPTMATVTATRSAYHIPTQTHYANTGPKGVIADAQSFARAKQSTFRRRLASFAGNFASSMSVSTLTEKAEKRKTISGSPKSTSSDSDNIHLSDDEADSEFMQTWRANRLQELASQSHAPQRRQSPSRRTWGTFVEVDANGYLDAVEKVPDETVVVVMIYDPASAASAEVGDELSMLAYKHNKTRFVRLHHEIAEMQSVEVPALLAYKGGDVFATISDVKAEDLEGVLLRYLPLVHRGLSVPRLLTSYTGMASFDEDINVFPNAHSPGLGTPPLRRPGGMYFYQQYTRTFTVPLVYLINALLSGHAILRLHLEDGHLTASLRQLSLASSLSDGQAGLDCRHQYPWSKLSTFDVQRQPSKTVCQGCPWSDHKY